MWVLILLVACGTPANDRERCFDAFDGDACLRIANENPRDTSRLQSMACRFGNLEGCAIRLRGFRVVGTPPGGEEGDRAKPRMTAACDADLPAGCRELGFLLSGQAARDAFGKACKLGDSEACAVLADAPPLSP